MSAHFAVGGELGGLFGGFAGLGEDAEGFHGVVEDGGVVVVGVVGGTGRGSGEGVVDDGGAEAGVAEVGGAEVVGLHGGV